MLVHQREMILGSRLFRSISGNLSRPILFGHDHWMSIDETFSPKPPCFKLKVSILHFPKRFFFQVTKVTWHDNS